MKSIEIAYKRIPAMEQIYNRLVSVLFMQKERNGINSYVFTGCEQKVGNTTVSLSIAAELAYTSKKTLFVDCDFLKPAEEKILFQYVDDGVAEYLKGDLPLDKIIYKTDIPALDYISSGKQFINPTMMLWSDKFSDFVQQVAQKYEFVIFDAAPILDAPEVGVLSFLVSGTILTVRFGKSLKSRVYAAKKELETMNANFLGIIVNKTPIDEYHIYQKTHGFSIVLKGSSESESGA